MRRALRYAAAAVLAGALALMAVQAPDLQGATGQTDPEQAPIGQDGTRQDGTRQDGAGQITPASAAAASTSAFPFQAQLQNSGGAVNGRCDLKFSLYDALLGGNKVAGDLFRADMTISNGLIATSLDFGDVFGSAGRWLEVAVRCPTGSGAYTTLSPRQEIGWLPRATLANRVLNLAEAPGDFAARGFLRSIRGSSTDGVAGGIELLNTISGNRWQMSTSRDQDELLVGLIDAASGWSHVASFYPQGGMLVNGDLYVSGVLSRTIETRGYLRSAVGDPNSTSAGTLELVNLLTNNTWQLTTNRDTDTLQWWFGENRATWKHIASMEPNGDVQFNYKLHVGGNAFSFLQSPAAILWQNTGAALGHAGTAGDYSVNAEAGDLVLRAADGKRLLLGRGNTAANYPAALTVAPSGLVSIPNLQTGGQVEANLQTAQEQAQAHIDRFERGDVLCWDAARQQTDRCTQPASPLVVGIANGDGKPLISGVEPIKVLAPVRPGDMLVAAATPGYAAAWAAQHVGEPPVGSVIAKALEACEQDCTTVTALILFR